MLANWIINSQLKPVRRNFLEKLFFCSKSLLNIYLNLTNNIGGKSMYFALTLSEKKQKVISYPCNDVN